MAWRQDRDRFRTVQVVTLTAFDPSGQLDLTVMQRQTERLLAAGVRAFIPCAGSAEFHALEPRDILAAVEMTRRTVGNDAVVIAPVGLQVYVARDLARRAADVGADALLVMPLTFPYLSDAGARDYYRSILDGSPCPGILYKKDTLPSANLLLDLAEHPRVLGVKYSLPDVTQFQQIVRKDGGRLEWYCGHAERYAPYFMLAGATGFTSGAANICPRISLRMFAALQAGNYAEAFHWQNALLPIEEFRARDNNSYNITFLKQAIRSCGFDFGDPRPPYRHLSVEERTEVDCVVGPILEIENQLTT